MQSHNGTSGFAVIVQEINDNLESAAGFVNVHTFGNSLDGLYGCHPGVFHDPRKRGYRFVTE